MSALMVHGSHRRGGLRTAVLVAAVLVAAVLVAGCGSQPAVTPGAAVRSVDAPTSPGEFPTEAFAELSEDPADNRTAATLRRALEQAAGGRGATATVMTRDWTWIGATGSADGTRAMRPGDQLAIASITKTIIAAQVMQLVEAGELDLDDRADHHLPEDLAFDTNGATVRDLLAMRSGIPDYVDALYESLLNDTAHVWTPSDLLALVPARRSPPASDFDYSSTNYVLLGLILEHTTGSSIASALRAGVLDGPDLERLVYQPDERPTFPRAQAGGSPAIPSRDGGDYLPSMAGATAAGAAGAIASDALTLARWWARLCGGEIVSDASLATMLDFDPTAAYGLGIQDWSADIAPSAIGNEGVHVGFVSRAGCLPESRLVVTVLINDEEADPAVVIHALLETLGSF